MFTQILIFGIYGLVSVPLFHVVHEASQEVIDEEFHLRQGLQYCEGDFSVWDPKITTFPGLYVVSAILHYPFGTCSVWNLRLTSLLASVVNLLLMYKIRRMVLSNVLPDKNAASIEWDTFSLSLLPPLYFFAHLYYTDVVALTPVLALFLFNLKNQHHLAALFGLIGVLMRQTNIVWVAMALGTTVIDKVVSQTLPFIKGNERYGKSDLVYSFKDIGVVLVFYCKRYYLIWSQVKLLVSHLYAYLLVLLAFVGFVLVNGSIVVGDKDAHTASLHLPQIFYFSLFVLTFGVSLWMSQIQLVLHTLYTRWAILFGLLTIALAIIYANTIVHPYLLADNRHYTFYIWNRFYGAFDLARYIIAPVYLVGLVVAYKSIAANKTAGFQMCYAICTLVAIAFQQMIEVRYFLVPFLWLRLNTQPLSKRCLLAEMLAYAGINAIAFYMFATKEIYWTDFAHVQRIIW